MANKKHLKVLEKGVKVWNQWRKINSFKTPDLTGADLPEAELSGADLRAADLNHANLTGANLSFAHLRSADLTEANLSRTTLIRANLRQVSFDGAQLVEAQLNEADLVGSYLRQANLSGAHLNSADLHFADLSGANLSGATLDGANLDSCNLCGADLSYAIVGYTMFVNVDLSQASGIDTIVHRAPSSIGIDTIYYSKAKIPAQFLQGAGVPESFIKNMGPLFAAMDPIELYSCFISHSSKDQEFASRLYYDLQSKGARCWLAPENLKIGDKLRPSFDAAIDSHEKLIILLSNHSIKSAWVEKEVETACEKERRTRRTVIVPIRLDDAIMETNEAWAADIRRTRHIGDFRSWKDRRSYKKSLERLLRDLQTQTKPNRQQKNEIIPPRWRSTSKLAIRGADREG